MPLEADLVADTIPAGRHTHANSELAAACRQEEEECFCQTGLTETRSENVGNPSIGYA